MRKWTQDSFFHQRIFSGRENPIHLMTVDDPNVWWDDFHYVPCTSNPHLDRPRSYPIQS